ncbi:hypothetical protein TNCV_1319161 [Trichonephila clavipes]|nr:hypothetical protein TNCV_1319161 [Trichonephila clavipes]
MESYLLASTENYVISTRTQSGDNFHHQYQLHLYSVTGIAEPWSCDSPLVPVSTDVGPIVRSQNAYSLALFWKPPLLFVSISKLNGHGPYYHLLLIPS